MDFSTLHVWTCIHNLPIYWWTAIISQISSALGKPLYMDQATASRSRISYIRVCVEMAAIAQPLDSLLVSLNGEPVVTLYFEYEWIPLRCSSCRFFGHNEKSCPVKSSPRQLWLPKSSLARSLIDDVSQEIPPAAKILAQSNCQPSSKHDFIATPTAQPSISPDTKDIVFTPKFLPVDSLANNLQQAPANQHVAHSSMITPLLLP